MREIQAHCNRLSVSNHPFVIRARDPTCARTGSTSHYSKQRVTSAVKDFCTNTSDPMSARSGDLRSLAGVLVSPITATSTIVITSLDPPSPPPPPNCQPHIPDHPPRARHSHFRIANHVLPHSCRRTHPLTQLSSSHRLSVSPPPCPALLSFPRNPSTHPAPLAFIACLPPTSALCWPPPGDCF
jgi:hypothetical protein